MPRISGKMRRQLDGDNPRLTVLLEDMFGRAVDDQALRLEIGQQIIDRIVDRSRSSLFLETGGTGKDGSGPLQYTKGYRTSFEFRVLKGNTRRVNLEATGDMFRAMDIIESEPDKLVLGFADPENAEKAHGHITGSVGKVRDFFGLPEVDLNRIRNSYQQEVNDQAGSLTAGEERAEGESNLDFLLRVLARLQEGSEDAS